MVMGEPHIDTHLNCTCTMLDIAVALLMRQVEHANQKVAYYTMMLDAQKQYSADILAAVNAISDYWELPRYSDIKQLASDIGSVGTIAYMLTKAGKYGKVMAKVVAGTIFSAYMFYYLTGLANWALEGFYQNRLNAWRAEFEQLLELLSETRNEYIDCKSKLEDCVGCGGSFRKDVQGCIKKCSGCERFYCTNCFDPALEKWELEHKKK